MANCNDINTDRIKFCERYPVDLVHLSKQTFGDRDLEKEVLGLFVNQSTIYLKRLETAKSAAERKTAAHTIVGSARGLGAWKVAQEAELLEAACELEIDCNSLSRALENATKYIRTLIN